MKLRFEGFHDRWMEWRLHIQTAGRVAIEPCTTRNQDPLPYEYLPYALLRQIIKKISHPERYHFADFGCGKGRVVCYAATQPFKKVTGIEAHCETASLAQRNALQMRGYQTRPTIIRGDVLDQDSSLFNVIFFYNPFGRKTMAEVLEKIKNSLIQTPRYLLLIYFNPLEAEILESCPWLERRDDLTVQALNRECARLPFAFFYETRISSL